MTAPHFHPDEMARIGPQAYDRRKIGLTGTVRCIMTPVGGEYRYGVKTASGDTIVLESTLQKVFEPGRWSDPDCVWQPDRTPRKQARPTAWKEWK